jgi:hypothetical protein
MQRAVVRSERGRLAFRILGSRYFLEIEGRVDGVLSVVLLVCDSGRGKLNVERGLCSCGERTLGYRVRQRAFSVS